MMPNVSFVTAQTIIRIKQKNSHLIARATSGDMAYIGPISIVNLTYAYPNKKIVGPMPSSGAHYK